MLKKIIFLMVIVAGFAAPVMLGGCDEEKSEFHSETNSETVVETRTDPT